MDYRISSRYIRGRLPEIPLTEPGKIIFKTLWNTEKISPVLIKSAEEANAVGLSYYQYAQISFYNTRYFGYWPLDSIHSSEKVKLRNSFIKLVNMLENKEYDDFMRLYLSFDRATKNKLTCISYDTIPKFHTGTYSSTIHTFLPFFIMRTKDYNFIHNFLKNERNAPNFICQITSASGNDNKSMLYYAFLDTDIALVDLMLVYGVHSVSGLNVAAVKEDLGLHEDDTTIDEITIAEQIKYVKEDAEVAARYHTCKANKDYYASLEEQHSKYSSQPLETGLLITGPLGRPNNSRPIGLPSEITSLISNYAGTTEALARHAERFAKPSAAAPKTSAKAMKTRKNRKCRK